MTTQVAFDDMRKLLAYSLAALAALSLIAILGLYPYHTAVLPVADDLQHAQVQLAPHLSLFTPTDQAGPFPTVIAFHGCSGQNPGYVADLQRWLLPAGYAVVFVDSLGARAVSDWQAVCAGKQLWGNERALDVYAALELVAALPQVDPQRIAVMGFSHGGWAILDALAYGGEAGHGYHAPGPAPLKRVRAAVTYYPYCGMPARLREASHVPQAVPILMLLAGKDSVTNHQQCLDSLAALEPAQVELVQYPQADHVFDQPSAMNTFQPSLAADAHRKTLNFLQQHLSLN